MTFENQRAGLLQAIIEEPDQDFPRLVFADWVSDHGQPEWGDFIRWHCALTNCMVGEPDPFAAFHGAPQEQMLLTPPCFLRPEIRKAVLQPLGRLMRHFAPERGEDDNEPYAAMQVRVGRGFVEWLGLHGGQAIQGFARFASEIFASTPLLWLRLDEYYGPRPDPVAPAQLRALLRVPEIRRLRALDLQDVRFGDELAEVVLRLADNVPPFRVYDRLQSDRLRERLQATFGERMRLRPVPDYLSRP